MWWCQSGARLPTHRTDFIGSSPHKVASAYSRSTCAVPAWALFTSRSAFAQASRTRVFPPSVAMSSPVARLMPCTDQPSANRASDMPAPIPEVCPTTTAKRLELHTSDSLLLSAVARKLNSKQRAALRAPRREPDQKRDAVARTAQPRTASPRGRQTPKGFGAFREAAGGRLHPGAICRRPVPPPRRTHPGRAAGSARLALP